VFYIVKFNAEIDKIYDVYRNVLAVKYVNHCIVSGKKRATAGRPYNFTYHPGYNINFTWSSGIKKVGLLSRISIKIRCYDYRLYMLAYESLLTLRERSKAIPYRKI